MSGVGSAGATPTLPRSIWVVAWASLAGQVVLLARQGARVGDEVSLVVSVVLGALLVGYVSAGVVRARAVRLLIAWVVLFLGLIAGVLGLVSAEDFVEAALAGLSLVTTAVTLAALASFRRTDWYAWQRTRPPARDGAPTSHLIAVGVLVGLLGGVAEPLDDGFDVHIEAAQR